MAMTNYLEEKILNLILRATAFTAPEGVYAALFTAAPGEAGGGTEVTGGSYARQPITFGVPSQGADAATCANSAEIAFPVATANWGTITHVALYDAASSGNMLFFAALSTAKLIETGDQFKFPIGNLSVTLN
jgi:hypothetical protein